MWEWTGDDYSLFKYMLLCNGNEFALGCVAAGEFANVEAIEKSWDARCTVCWCLPCSFVTIQNNFENSPTKMMELEQKEQLEPGLRSLQPTAIKF